MYNMLGQTTRKLSGADDPGVILVRWDGKNEKGKAVASGVYFYSAKAGAFAATKKMLLLKQAPESFSLSQITNSE